MALTVKTSGAVLTFGELLLRITPDTGGQWLKNNQLQFHVGGAELNVATALALWGIPTKYFTALPDNGMCDQLLEHLNEKQIDTSAVHRGGSRLGIFYLTKGHDMKHDALVYDRANSAFAELKPGIIDWAKVFEGVKWFHFTAICPAISQQTADLCEEALMAASKLNIVISIDLNYRAKLWQYGKDAHEIMPRLLPYCDVVMGNVWAAEKMLDIPIVPNIHETGQKSIYLKEALLSAAELMKQYPRCSAVAYTFRFDGGSHIEYYTALYTDDHLYHSAVYESDVIVDKVGSGDCFMAGLIYGFSSQLNLSEVLDFATAAAFDKLFIPGDATTSTVEHIKKTMKYEN